MASAARDSATAAGAIAPFSQIPAHARTGKRVRQYDATANELGGLCDTQHAGAPYNHKAELQIKVNTKLRAHVLKDWLP